MTNFPVESGAVIIQSVQGTTPGPASAISYTCTVQFPSQRYVNVAGIVPCGTRPDDTYDTDAAGVGTCWPATLINGQLHAHIHESKADDDECP